MDTFSNQSFCLLENFPVSLRVLLIDNDLASLQNLIGMLHYCGHEVIHCQGAMEALTMLGENGNMFDIVMSDVHNGIVLLPIITSKMDLPVVLMSAGVDSVDVANGVMKGARDYLIKPIQIGTIQVLWRHVLRESKGKLQVSNMSNEGLLQLDNGVRNRRETENSERRKHYENNQRDIPGVATTTKQGRLKWKDDLQKKFTEAVNSIGFHKATGKEVLKRMQEMDVKNLTLAQVASHLQHYRKSKKKRAEMDVQGLLVHEMAPIPLANVADNAIQQSSLMTTTDDVQTLVEHQNYLETDSAYTLPLQSIPPDNTLPYTLPILDYDELISPKPLQEDDILMLPYGVDELEDMDLPRESQNFAGFYA